MLTADTDPLCVYDRNGQQTHAIRNILAGRSVFLAAGGPSAAELPLEHLYRRGAWTLAVNNMAGHPRFRPQAFVCTDPPEKFSYSVWNDPGIMKFMPDVKLVDPGRGKLRRKSPDGTFSPLLDQQGRPVSTKHCPNVWGIKRRKWMAMDDTFFSDDAAPNGNYKEGATKLGEPKTICTLFFAIRTMRYLGAREIFLVGVDFYMPTNSAGYAFDQGRTEGACHSNNHQYSIANDWLCRLQQNGVFERHDLSIYNCNQVSCCRAFPYVPFEEAIERVCRDVEPEPDLFGYYEKKEKVERPAEQEAAIA